MTTKAKSLARTAALLPLKDRTYMAEQLLASLDETDLDQEWTAEAKRRRDEVRSGRVKPIPAEEEYRPLVSAVTSRLASTRASGVCTGP